MTWKRSCLSPGTTWTWTVSYQLAVIDIAPHIPDSAQLVWDDTFLFSGHQNSWGLQTQGLILSFFISLRWPCSSMAIPMWSFLRRPSHILRKRWGSFRMATAPFFPASGWLRHGSASFLHSSGANDEGRDSELLWGMHPVRHLSFTIAVSQTWTCLTRGGRLQGYVAHHFHFPTNQPWLLALSWLGLCESQPRFPAMSSDSLIKKAIN